MENRSEIQTGVKMIWTFAISKQTQESFGGCQIAVLLWFLKLIVRSGTNATTLQSAEGFPFESLIRTSSSKHNEFEWKVIPEVSGHSRWISLIWCEKVLPMKPQSARIRVRLIAKNRRYVCFKALIIVTNILKNFRINTSWFES